MADQDYNADLKVDLYDLHREWQRQPHLRMKWGEAHAQAGYDHRQARKRRNVIKAEVQLEVRGYPAKFGVEKVTDKSVEAAVIMDPRVQQAETELAAAERNENVLYSAVRAIENKRESLKHEVMLWQAGYYADRSVPKEVKEATAAAGAKAQAKQLKSSLKRRKKD